MAVYALPLAASNGAGEKSGRSFVTLSAVFFHDHQEPLATALKSHFSWARLYVAPED